MTDKLPDHIMEYLDTSPRTSRFIELFEADEKNIDLKTDVTHPEIILVNAIIFNDNFLINKGIPSPYHKFIDKYLRLKTSKGRESRKEFVDINRSDNFEKDANKFNTIANLQKVKQ